MPEWAAVVLTILIILAAIWLFVFIVGTISGDGPGDAAVIASGLTGAFVVVTAFIMGVVWLVSRIWLSVPG